MMPSVLIVFLVFVFVFMLVVRSWGMLFKYFGFSQSSAVIPIVNMYIISKIADIPVYLFVLSLVPPLLLPCYLIMFCKIARRLGRSCMYGVGMMFVPFVFIPIAIKKNSECMRNG